MEAGLFALRWGSPVTCSIRALRAATPAVKLNGIGEIGKSVLSWGNPLDNPLCMAESPASQVYSPQVLGDAVLLGSGLGPLTVLRQESAARARAKAAAAKLKQQQEDSDARNAVPIAANGWLPHTEQLKAAVQGALAANTKTYQDESLTHYQKKMAAYDQLNAVKQLEDRSNEMGKKRADIEAQAKADSRYNKDEALKEFDNQVYGVDPTTGAKNATAQSINSVDIAKFDDILNNGKNLNRDEVLKKFIKQEADSENNRVGQAALPGGFGLTTAFQSNIFARDKNNRPVFNADGSQKINDLPALMARAKNDPFMAKVLAQDALNLQNQAGAEQMRQGTGYEQLSPDMQTRMQALGAVGDAQTRVSLPTDLAPYGKTKTSEIQSYHAKPQPRRPAALKANEAAATETSGYTLQNTMEQAPAILTPGMAPGVAGVYDYAQPFAKASGSMPKPTNSYVPGTGHSFSTSKNGYVTMNLSSNGITTMGSDGKPNVTNASGSNSQVPFQTNSRQTILFMDGKPLPGQGDGSGQSARQEQSRILQAAQRAGQGSRITAQEYYVGGTTDKSKVNGDGAGGAPKIIGYKDGNNNMITNEMAAEFAKAGLTVTPVLANQDNLIKGIHPASQEGDAQLRAMVKGYDPSKLSADQQSVIRELQSIGGRHISPYSVTPPAAAPKALYTKAAATAAKPAVETVDNGHKPYYTKRVK